eukprot:TRINITY_DN46995_c0_g1_i1.p1 TRINITY_DN46995_c0_g1~~TRINITY_DN46995_c0_g1_i1.p1  ORF type:complete len:113 (-),score=19.52 TRINITY_DN46995_c0_g1_i1:82-420(-)
MGKAAKAKKEKDGSKAVSRRGGEESMMEVVESQSGFILICVTLLIVAVVYHAADVDLPALFAQERSLLSQVSLVVACGAVPGLLSFLVSSFLAKFVGKANSVFVKDRASKGR